MYAIRSYYDFVGKQVSVSSAMVVGVIKGTKTKAGARTIELSNEALSALADQKRFTFLHSEFVFHDPKTEHPWAGADAIRKKAWIPTLKKAGVRYRHPYVITSYSIHYTKLYEIWRQADLKPHRLKTFKISSDPHFADKVVDIVGLYLNPPDQAMVLCVDEKTSYNFV